MSHPIITYPARADPIGRWPSRVGFATHFVFLAVSYVPKVALSGAEPELVCAWNVKTPDGGTLYSGGNCCSSSGLEGRTEALLSAAIEAVAQPNIPVGSRLHVVADLDRFTKLLNEDRKVRQKMGYLRKSRPPQPLAHANKWRELDAAFDKRNLAVSASNWWSDESRWALNSMKKRAVELRMGLRRRPPMG
jgi:hypothetical protein